MIRERAHRASRIPERLAGGCLSDAVAQGRSAMCSGQQAGFSLIELTIALVIAGILLLGGRQMLEAIAEESARVRQSARLAAVEANGERILREVIGRMEIGTSPDFGFGGTEREASFASWCEVPDGWLERCRVSLTLDSSLALTSRLIASERDELQRIVIRRDVERGALRYLNSASDGGVWFRGWGRGITAPLAIGIITGRDTMIVSIGERG